MKTVTISRDCIGPSLDRWLTLGVLAMANAASAAGDADRADDLQGRHHLHRHRPRRVQRPRRRAEGGQQAARLRRRRRAARRGRRPPAAGQRPAAAATAAPAPAAEVHCDGHRRRPATRTPTGATAKCKDGTYSKSKNHSGACSKHGGVDQWLDGSQVTAGGSALRSQRSTGRGQTFSSSAAGPPDSGCMPSACMRSGFRATSASRNGTSGTCLSRARSA